MRLSAHFSFKKPEGNDVIGPDAFNDNSDTIDKILFNSSVIEDADGTANAITLTELTLENGYIKKFKAKYNNNPTKLTTINSKKVYRAGTTEAPTFIANKAYTVWYNASGDNFFIEASAEGDVEASNVLSGKYFSNSKDTNIPGTMPNNSSINASLSCGESITIPLGYTPGGTVRANSLISQTGGVTADDAKVLNGYTYWKEGIKRTGTMANKATGTPNLIKYVRNNNNRIEIAVDEGYHGCFWDGGLYEYLPYSALANVLGITSDKIVNGQNICGVNGNVIPHIQGGTGLYKMYSSYSEGTDYPSRTFDRNIDIIDIQFYYYTEVSTNGKYHRGSMTYRFDYEQNCYYMQKSYFRRANDQYQYHSDPVVYYTYQGDNWWGNETTPHLIRRNTSSNLVSFYIMNCSYAHGGQYTIYFY